MKQRERPLEGKAGLAQKKPVTVEAPSASDLLLAAEREQMQKAENGRMMLICQCGDVRCRIGPFTTVWVEGK